MHWVRCLYWCWYYCYEDLGYEYLNVSLLMLEVVAAFGLSQQATGSDLVADLIPQGGRQSAWLERKLSLYGICIICFGKLHAQ